MLTTDQTYHWCGFGDGFGNWESRCLLRIFRLHPKAIVVVASDLGGDTETSITNCAGQLARRLVKEFELDLACLTWIEHIPMSKAAFSLVQFDWQGNTADHPR
ncbi:MAG: hypothetical protein HC895_00270 [Leptolyngbyaceae cyanobacterium SM1_3_5]|nr:hypothetical protein [Leptolyngbyaceae cyanobacterium SM1_3_5]